MADRAAVARVDVRITETPLAGMLVVEPKAFVDHRGAFFRRFCERELSEILGARHIVQMNQSLTRAVGAVRGVHYQRPPQAEMKLISCLHGRVHDVAVDVRAGSPTFLRWHAVELSRESGRMLVLPEGFAHGFQVLEPESELLYLHTAFYTPECEAGLLHDDPRLAIDWPLPPGDLSERDRRHPRIAHDFPGIVP